MRFWPISPDRKRKCSCFTAPSSSKKLAILKIRCPLCSVTLVLSTQEWNNGPNSTTIPLRSHQPGNLIGSCEVKDKHDTGNYTSSYYL